MRAAWPRWPEGEGERGGRTRAACRSVAVVAGGVAPPLSCSHFSDRIAATTRVWLSTSHCMLKKNVRKRKLEPTSLRRRWPPIQLGSSEARARGGLVARAAVVAKDDAASFDLAGEFCAIISLCFIYSRKVVIALGKKHMNWF
ncbi:uncharacterized protein LOC125546142 isoform X1 [Triticum urartu]|uniref:uncharacterized protein LOC125546142 isoform X1 n=1 Tax=Triticum urartu TaxID=4572 RepID=UPI002044252B|nr:uncharacterized protein LOC125546142 isoform X1 [Triticum urartu]